MRRKTLLFRSPCSAMFLPSLMFLNSVFQIVESASGQIQLPTSTRATSQPSDELDRARQLKDKSLSYGFSWGRVNSICTNYDFDDAQQYAARTILFAAFGDTRGAIPSTQSTQGRGPTFAKNVPSGRYFPTKEMTSRTIGREAFIALVSQVQSLATDSQLKAVARYRSAKAHRTELFATFRRVLGDQPKIGDREDYVELIAEEFSRDLRQRMRLSSSQRLQVKSLMEKTYLDFINTNWNSYKLLTSLSSYEVPEQSVLGSEGYRAARLKITVAFTREFRRIVPEIQRLITNDQMNCWNDTYRDYLSILGKIEANIRDDEPAPAPGPFALPDLGFSMMCTPIP